MQCPKCFTETDEGQPFCHHCGFSISTSPIRTTHPIYHHNALNTQPKQQSPKLIFNMIFAILLLFSGGNTCVGLIGSLPVLLSSVQGLSIVGTLTMLGVACVAVVNIVTGIALINRKRFGYILSIIINSIHGLGGLALCGLGVWVNILTANTSQTDYERIGYAIGIIMLICGLPILVFNVCSLFYYKKNKIHFK